MICKCCGSPLDKESNFCMKCGTKVVRTEGNVCRICGKTVPSDMSFCGYCGNCIYTSYGSGKTTGPTPVSAPQSSPNYTISRPPEAESPYKRLITAFFVVVFILTWIIIILFMLGFGEAKKQAALKNKQNVRSKSDITETTADEDEDEDEEETVETSSSKKISKQVFDIWSGNDD